MGFLEGLGLHLGGLWEAIGRSPGVLGRLLAVFWAFEIKLFSNMGPRWAPRGHLDRYWEGLGMVWEGFGEGFGRIWYLFNSLWANFGHI